MRKFVTASALVLALGLGACGPVMEARRPDPVDLSQFKPGEKRLEVVKVVGAPPATIADGANSCDVYQLYTHGPSGGGKAAAAFGEGVTDVFTLGLAEVIWTPTEALTKNSLYTVTFCYDKDAQLLKIDEENPSGQTSPSTQAPLPDKAGG